MQGTRVALAAALVVCLTGFEAPSDDHQYTALADAAKPPSHSAVMFVASVPPVRTLELDGPATGAEPDPESFDRAGLDAWWGRYLQLRPAASGGAMIAADPLISGARPLFFREPSVQGEHRQTIGEDAAK